MAVDVQGIINSAQTTAREMANNASTMVQSAVRAFDTRYELGQGNIPLSLTDVQIDLPQISPYTGARFEAPDSPGQPDALLPVPELLNEALPASKVSKPTFVEPPRPSDTPSVTLGSAPSIGSIYIPPAPDALMNFEIEVPTLTDIVVPKAPAVTLPAFDAQRPNVALTDPGDLTEQYRIDFADQGNSLRSALESAVDAQLAKINPRFHEQMDAIETRLAKYLKGGTALPPEVEDAIFNRAADKTNAEYLRTRDAAYGEAAARGFTLPSGAVYSAVIQARQAAADNNARAAMEIAIKQAELEQQNLQFAVTQSMNLRQIVLNTSMAWAGNLVQLNAQALQFAQGVLQAAVDIYDIKVKIAQAQVQVYQAEAQVYEYRLKAVLAVYDVYAAEVKALEAQVGVDQARVQAFTARMSGYGALANAYKAMLEGVATKAQIEKIKVDAFGTQVQAYSAAVQGKTAEWQAYKAQLEGNVAKFDAYKAEVQAYSVEVDAYKTRVEASAKRVEAVAAANESSRRQYEAAVSAYSALVHGQSSAVQAELGSYEVNLKHAIAVVNAQEAKARQKLASMTAMGNVAVSAYQTNAQIAIANAQMNYKRMNDTASVILSGAKAYGDMAGSALSGINSLAAGIEQTSL